MAAQERSANEPDGEHESSFEAMLGELEVLRKRLLNQYRLELNALRQSVGEINGDIGSPGQASPDTCDHEVSQRHDHCSLSDQGKDRPPASRVELPLSRESAQSDPQSNSALSGDDGCEPQFIVAPARSGGSRASIKSNLIRQKCSNPDLNQGHARRSDRRPSTLRGRQVNNRRAALTFTTQSNNMLAIVESQVLGNGTDGRLHSARSLAPIKGYTELLLDFVQYLVQDSTWFENIIRVAIILNSVYIGVEIQWSLDGIPPSWFLQLEHWFLIAFITELTLRAVAEGRASLRSSWFLFDLFVVTLGALSTWILEPIISALSSGHPLGHELTAVRTLRLLRLVRLFRLSQYFKELWKMCRGMAQAGRAASSATLLVLVAIYVFACVSVEAITREYEDDPEIGEIVSDRFRSLPVTMLTLMQFATEDSLNQMYVPIIERAPSLAIYFGMVWLVVTVLIMNLVTAVIVESAIGQASQDREMRNKDTRKKLKKMVPQLEDVFDKLDANKEGEIWLEDIDLAVVPLPRALQGVIEEDMLQDLFSVSLDGCGKVRKDEFVEAVTLLAYSEVPVETTQMLHLLRHIQIKVLDLEAYIVGAEPDEEVEGAPQSPPEPDSHVSDSSSPAPL